METKVIGLNKGIRLNPTVGTEGELLDCVNLVVKNGELMNAPRMVDTGKTCSGKLWYVHKTSDGVEHYIDDNMLTVTFGLSGIIDVTSVGNMLNIACTDGLRHAVWKDNSYVLLPKSMPDLDVECALSGEYNVYTYENPVYYIKDDGVVGYDTIVSSKQGAINSNGGDYSIEGYTIFVLEPSVEGASFPTGRYKIIFQSTGHLTEKIRYYIKGLYHEGDVDKSEYIVDFYKEDVANLEITFNADKSYDYIYFGVQFRNSGTGVLSNSVMLYSGTSVSDTVLVNDSEHDSFSAIKGAIFSFFRKYGNIKHRFINPFFVRCAYRLFDGSYVYHTSPCLLIPNSGKYPLIRPITVAPGTAIADAGRLAVSANTADLLMKIAALGTADVWTDIITDVVVAISAPIYSYKDETDKYILEAEMRLKGYNQTDLNGFCQGKIAGVEDEENPGALDTRYKAFEKSNLESTFNKGANLSYMIDVPRHDSISKQVENSSVFYVVKKIPYKDVVNGNYSSLSKIDFSDVSFDNLVTYPELSDENMSLNRYKPSLLASYNNRLHIANYDKVFFNGHSIASFSAYGNENTSKEYVFEVEVHEQNKTILVYSKKSSTSNDIRWFYYPHNSAKRVTIYEKDESSYNKAVIDLKSHPTLNGSYWFNEFNKVTFVACESVPNNISAIFGGYTVESTIHSNTNIIVSEVDCPYSFKYDGVLDVGAEIKAISVATMALEREQHGESPLISFVGDGVVSIGLNSEGKYVKKQYVSRDVLIDNAKPLQLDNAIVFPTESGLMMMQNGALPVCISKKLEGRDASDMDSNGGSDVEAVAFVDSGYNVSNSGVVTDGSGNYHVTTPINVNKGDTLQIVSMVDPYADPRLVYVNTLDVGVNLGLINAESVQTDGTWTATKSGAICLVDLNVNGTYKLYSNVVSSGGKSFNDIIKNCLMLWDSDNGFVHVFDASTSGANDCHYIYSVDAKEWTKSDEMCPTTIVAGYPRSFMQSDGKLYWYTKNNDNIHYEGTLITKEVAFDNAFAYKMLWDMRVMRKEEYYMLGFTKVRTVKVKVMVSNDRVHWAVLPSLKMRSYKWYRFIITTSLTDMDGLEGIVCRTEERLTNKLR